MKKIVVITVLFAIIILPTSCLTSLQQLVTIDKMIREDRVLGTWQHENTVFHIEKMDSSQLVKGINEQVKTDESVIPKYQSPDEKADSIYHSKAYIVYFIKENIQYHMAAGFIRIGGDLFMELLPVYIYDPKHPDGVSYMSFVDYVPAFMFARVTLNGNNELIVHFLNGDFIRKQIQSGNMGIKYESDLLSNTFLVTASSYDLQQFLQKYGHDERLYSTGNSITLTKKG